MTRRIVGLAVVAAGALAVTTGCMPKMTVEEMKAMMPEKPADLEKLNAFIGTWEFEGEAKFEMLDRPLKCWGTSTSQWDGDGWYVVGTGTFNLEELGEMKGHEVWAYDSKAKVYRSTWVDSMGMIGMGTGKYNEKKDIWTMTAKSYGPHGESTMTGTVKFIDPDTMEWDWAEYAWGGLMKTMTMTGTSKRKP